MRDERLIRFAVRLYNIKIKEKPDIRQAWIESSQLRDNTWYCVTFNMHFFLELPIVFNEWSYYEAGDEVEVKRYPKYTGMGGMISKFFNLQPNEFTHLFDLDGNQNLRAYGGVRLNRSSTSQDIAFNIIEFLKIWEEI